MRLNQTLLFFAILILIVMTRFGTTAVQAAQKSVAVKIKPDIVLKEMTITCLGIEASGAHRLQIKAVVSNPVAMSSTGPFKVMVEFGSSGSSIDHILAEENVAGLTNNGASLTSPSATVLFHHIAKPGRAYFYRVTADSLGLVDEANEANNRRVVEYRVPPVILGR